MNTRVRMGVIACAAILAFPQASPAQKHDRVWRMGFLAARRHLGPSEPDYYDEVARELRQLGYVEGKNLVIEWRFADGKYERLPELAEELARTDVDVIVTDGTAGTLAAQKATRKIPIVFGSAGGPVENGLIKSLAHPGGNTTGISLLTEDTSTKQIEMLSQMVPNLTRVAVLYNPTNPYHSHVGTNNLETAGKLARVRILRAEARSAGEIDDAFTMMTREGVGAFFWIPDALFVQERQHIARLAATHRIPGMGPRIYTDAGGLMSYGPNQAANYRRAAAYVAKIFKGANPADLPVEQPTKIELVINRRVAKTLGLTIPPELLVLADRVIE